MTEDDRAERFGKPAKPTRFNGTKPQESVRRPAVPGAAGRPDSGDRSGDDYVESQPGGGRDDLMDRPNRPPRAKN
ncbi:MAG: hypothetical protein ACT6XY_03315 [Phreatobacter sp.]|uniref:hypothetical protein n=1 Tax=Phreatobacter sp. TaxID=1966341 RepID=UPI004035E333